MKIFISGISGTGMGPLALMAKKAGLDVCGTDLTAGAILPELIKNNIEVKIGTQDGEFLKSQIETIDWFVYTSALAENHPELQLAKQFGLKVSKRDELIAFLTKKLNLKMVAVAGTHGKTTTTAMITFAALKLGLPVSYLVGTTLGFAPSGAHHDGDRYFIYEADEYDRNFLRFEPWLSVITTVSYDHPDIYPTREDYEAAFRQFEGQSKNVVKNTTFDGEIKLAGAVRRYDAGLALEAIMKMAQDVGRVDITVEQATRILEQFRGVGRRFEKLADGIYTDYAHHPEEIAATVEVAKEAAKILNKKGVVVVYQPHQNTRQVEVQDGYTMAFEGADKVLWLPTYLTRENPDLAILTPQDLISKMKHPEIAEAAELNDNLAEKIKQYQKDNYLIILMTAGPADTWLRQII